MDSIKIGSRSRKDLGDIASFAKQISEIGLLHPIVVNQNHERTMPNHADLGSIQTKTGSDRTNPIYKECDKQSATSSCF